MKEGKLFSRNSRRRALCLFTCSSAIFVITHMIRDPNLTESGSSQMWASDWLFLLSERCTFGPWMDDEYLILWLTCTNVDASCTYWFSK